jgi:hypothetical protein
LATPKKSEQKQRDEKGLFAKGNTIGRQFQPGNDEGSKYKPEYADRLTKFFKEHEGFPTLEAFAGVELGVSLNTITNWAKSHPDFEAAVSVAKTIQLAKIHEGTMTKRYDATYAKFLAINNHGMSEKTQVDLGNKDESGFKITVTIDE